MKITALETVRIAERPKSDLGSRPYGRGHHRAGRDFFSVPALLRAHIHDWVAPKVFGQDPLQIDRLAADLVTYVGFRSAGGRDARELCF